MIFLHSASCDSVHELRKSPVSTVAVCLGLLGVLLLAGTIGQAVSYNKTERDQQDRYNALAKEKNITEENLQTALKEKKDLHVSQANLETSNNYLFQRRQQLQTNVNILTRETNNLKTIQSQLQKNNNDLMKEKDQLAMSQSQLSNLTDTLSKNQSKLKGTYDTAVKQNAELKSSHKSLQKDVNNLQNQYNIHVQKREDLQIKYNTLIQKVEQLQLNHNFTNTEKDKLHSTHGNLTTEIENLQESFFKLVRERDQLQASYESLVSDKNSFQNSYKNASTERDNLKEKRDTLSAEVEQLRTEADRMSNLTEDKSCPPGWKKFESSCYFTSAGKASWQKSRQKCRDRAADLVIINSKEEMTFINGLYASDKEVWIGLSDSGMEGEWKWVDGTPLTTAFWGKGQPNSHNGNQDCVEVWHRATGQGDWNDENCNDEQEWICET
uniref:C-type lectin domain-containing protein n=1 Tax=Myripristis murdjan TaxID=586833 RepID=A0A667WLU0_9TELE